MFPIDHLDETLKDDLHEHACEGASESELDVGDHAVAKILLITLLQATEHLLEDVMLTLVGKFPKLLLRGLY